MPKETLAEVAARKYSLSIANVVINFSVQYKLDLEILVEMLNARYGKEIFPAAVSSCRNTNTKNSMFESGQVIIAGAKSHELALLAVYRLVERFRKDFNIGFMPFNFATKNIVCSTHLGYPLDLDLLAATKPLESNFEEELFKGLNYTMRYTDAAGVRRKVCSVAFEGGTVLITGIKNTSSMDNINQELKFFKAFELAKDYRVIPEEARDVYYGTKEWRQWGLVINKEDNARLANKITEKRKRKRTIVKQNRSLKMEAKKRQKKLEDDTFNSIKQYKKEMQAAGMR